MDLVLKKMQNDSNRKAQFKTVIALNINNEQHLFTGIVEGEIRKEKTGTNGFGYDPIFEPEQLGKTFAEMTLDEKNTLSHRGRAVNQLVNFLKNLK
jgi:XTP/dITP diphosphohydrolase